jgi:mannose-6-phosphate isomerase-like protein (cupin superfamily)
MPLASVSTREAPFREKQLASHFYRTKVGEAPLRKLDNERGISHMLVNQTTGAANLDVHINELKVDSGPGERHFHAKAENVYIVLEGCLEVVVEGERHLLLKDDVGWIPAGIVHTAGNAGTHGVCRMIEIYAPAGKDFNVVDSWKRPDA